MTAASQPLSVYVAGNSTVHAGRVLGRYASGNPRYGKLCSSAGSDRHDAMPTNGAAITCKRCLAKLAKRDAARSAS